jgi:aryl-alcohol dehydrogenase-like predicted oxidoreductase
VPFFPLGGAHFPEWPKVTEEPTVIEIAARIGVTPSQIGLAWLLAHKSNILLIPGTASISHLEENIASASIELDEAALSELDAIGDQT